MSDKKMKKKDTTMQQPIEKHDTAAWSNDESSQDVTHVNLPNQTQVRNAKEWVDSNQK